MQFETRIGDSIFDVEIHEKANRVVVNGEQMDIEWIVQRQGRILLRVDTHLFRIDNTGIDDREITFTINGTWRQATVKDEKDRLLEQLGFASERSASGSILEAPMPGKIVEILVGEGDEIEEGQPVVILEAMKMENELKAPESGVVYSLKAVKGDTVEKRQPILEIRPRG